MRQSWSNIKLGKVYNPQDHLKYIFFYVLKIIRVTFFLYLKLEGLSKNITLIIILIFMYVYQCNNF